MMPSWIASPLEVIQAQLAFEVFGTQCIDGPATIVTFAYTVAPAVETTCEESTRWRINDKTTVSNETGAKL